MYKFKCKDRNYKEYTFIDAKLLSDKHIPLDLNPIEHKLFNQDIFDFLAKISLILRVSLSKKPFTFFCLYLL